MKLLEIYNKLFEGDTVDGLPFEINNKNGVGATPLNQDIGYFGFIIEMRPLEFLTIAKKRNYPIDDGMWDEMLKRGIGAPFLNVVWVPWIYTDKDDGRWVCVGHEGRGRMALIHDNIGNDIKIPVHMVPYKMRANNDKLTSKMKNVKPNMIESERDLNKFELKGAYEYLGLNYDS